MTTSNHRIRMAPMPLLAALYAAAMASMAHASEPCQAPANLIANPGFELGPYGPNASPNGWQFESGYGTSVGHWDNTIAHGGRRSVRIDASGADDAKWLQPVPAPLNQLLYLGGWIKSQEVQAVGQPDSPGATVSILGRWDQPAPTLGTTPWHEVGFSFFGDTSPLLVAPRLGFWGGLASGVAWFDDLVLVPRVPGTPHPQWKILVLIYPLTDVSYSDAQGTSRHVKGVMSPSEVGEVTAQARHFVEQDIPRLSSGNMLPDVTVRQVKQPLKTLTPFFQGWWPAQGDVIKELDSAFDSVIVIWNPRGHDVMTGEPITIPGDGAVTQDRGLSQTYTTIRLAYAGVDGKRDTYKQQWAIGMANYFQTMGLISPTPVSFNLPPSQYVNCETGQGYEATGGVTGTDPVYDDRAGFFHDFYSGKVARIEAPHECLGISSQAWAWGGPVTHSGSRPVFTSEERVDALMAQVDALRDAKMLNPVSASWLRYILQTERLALRVKHSPIAQYGLDFFIKQVQLLVGRKQLLEQVGLLLIEAAQSADACVGRN